MSRTIESRQDATGTLDAVAETAADALLAAGFLFAMDALAHLKLTPADLGMVAAGWMAALLVGRWIGRVRDWLPLAVELVLPAVWLGLCNSQLKQAWSAPQVVYAVLFVCVLRRGWRWWLDRSATLGVNRRAESLRLLLVGLAAGGTVLPFFTDLQLGGADAKWYTGVFFDFVGQLRAGFFPVFVGQGEFSFNGSVNLFRSAPLCLWIGGVWDLLTAQSLSPIAIRNLAVITAAMGAGFGMYAVLIRLRCTVLAGVGGDGLRWAAALIAVLYVQCPSVLHALYYYELQMTFTAMIALPWVFYGNVRTLHGTDGRGYLPLGIGLAVVWMAHAPLAMICILCTAVLQLGRFVFEPRAIIQWKAAAGGALLFGLLGAYYFLGMSEVPTGLGLGMGTDAVCLGGIVLVVFGVVRVSCHGKWSGGLAWLVGSGLIGASLPVWLAWVGGWSVLFGLTVLILRRVGRRCEGPPAVWWAVATMLGAAALAGYWTSFQNLPHDVEPVKALARNAASRFELFRPLPEPEAMTPHSPSAPGLSLWLLAALVLFAALRLRDLALSLLAAVIVLMVVLVLGLPGMSDFIVTFSPPQVANLVNLPMLYRMVPPLAALTALAGFLSLARLGGAHTGWRRWGLAALVAGALWSSWEAQKLVRYGQRNLASRAATEVSFVPQNYALGRYSYAMLIMPTAYIDGKQFPWLESRLLNPLGDLMVGPDQLARQAEEFNSDTVVLTSQVDENNAGWLHVAPEWKVQPGQTLLLRLEIPEATDSSGYLILRSEHAYQEYHLTKNYPGTGFGITQFASRVLSVTNPGIHIEHYKMLLKVDPGNTMPRDGRPWAKLHVSLYDPERAPIKIESLMPYRARVIATRPGFLEIPRQWLPGYRADVDGRPVAVAESPGAFMKVPINAGTQTVELRYVGTIRLWAGLLVSGATLAGLLAWRLTGGWERQPVRIFSQWIEANRT